MRCSCACKARCMQSASKVQDLGRLNMIWRMPLQTNMGDGYGWKHHIPSRLRVTTVGRSVQPALPEESGPRPTALETAILAISKCSGGFPFCEHPLWFPFQNQPRKGHPQKKHSPRSNPGYEVVQEVNRSKLLCQSSWPWKKRRTSLPFSVGTLGNHEQSPCCLGGPFH